MEGFGIEGMNSSDMIESEQRTLEDTDTFIQCMKQQLDYYESRTKVHVDGFDISTYPVDLYKSLENLFKTCGEVEDIEMDIDRVKKQLTSTSCVVYIRGEGAEQRIPLLDGSVLGGKKLHVTISPVKSTDGLTTLERATKQVAEFQRSRSEAISVTGYDFSLPQEDVKNIMRKHFASCCGEITDIFVEDRCARVYMYALGSVHRALQLNGTDLGGGFKLRVQEYQLHAKPEETEAEAAWSNNY